MKSFAGQVKHIVPFSLQKKAFAPSLSRDPSTPRLRGFASLSEFVILEA